jgi:hypothetical protein
MPAKRNNISIYKRMCDAFCGDLAHAAAHFLFESARMKRNRVVSCLP